MNSILSLVNLSLRGRNKIHSCTEEFNALVTNEERIIFVMKVLVECGICPFQHVAEKNSAKSMILREEGNKIFASKSFDGKSCLAVLKLYTESIAYAPCPSTNLALAYANRSAVIFRLGRYEECIADIDRALATGYPEVLRAKLYMRKMECLTALRSPDADKLLGEVQEWMEKMSINEQNRNKLEASLQSARVFKGGNKHRYVKYQQTPVPQLASSNLEIPCASDAIQLMYNSKYGRHLVATRDISPGEVIAVEKPYSMLLSASNLYTHCSCCLEVCLTSIPCEHCVYAMYCSEKCKTTHWDELHDVECTILPALKMLRFSKLDLLGLRVVVQTIKRSKNLMEIREVLRELKASDPRTRGFNKDGQFDVEHYRAIYSLSTNQELRSSQDLFRRVLDSIVITFYLTVQSSILGTRLDKDLSVLMENEDFVFVASLVLLQQQIIPINMFACMEVRGLETEQRGSLALSFCGLINHSCIGNVTRHCWSTHMVIYSMAPIQKGEQITTNYRSHWAVVPTEVRQSELMDQYFFKCNCSACQKNWPLYYHLKSYKELMKPKEAMRITSVMTNFDEIVEQLKNGHIKDKEQVLKDLLAMVQVLHKHGPKSCLEMCDVSETLLRLYDLNGNRFDPLVLVHP